MARQRATHTLEGWPVRLISEWKDQRRVRFLAGPRYGEEIWVHERHLKPVSER